MLSDASTRYLSADKQLEVETAAGLVAYLQKAIRSAAVDELRRRLAIERDPLDRDIEPIDLDGPATDSDPFPVRQDLQRLLRPIEFAVVDRHILDRDTLPGTAEGLGLSVKQVRTLLGRAYDVMAQYLDPEHGRYLNDEEYTAPRTIVDLGERYNSYFDGVMRLNSKLARLDDVKARFGQRDLEPGETTYRYEELPLYLSWPTDWPVLRWAASNADTNPLIPRMLYDYLISRVYKPSFFSPEEASSLVTLFPLLDGSSKITSGTQFHYSRSFLLYLSGKYDEAHQERRRALDTASRKGDHVAESELLSKMLGARRRPPNPADEIELLERAITVSEDKWGQVELLLRIAELSRRMASDNLVESALDDAERLLGSVDLPTETPVIEHERGLLAFRRGQWEKAANHLTRAASVHVEGINDDFHSLLWADLARTWVHAGRPDLARDAIRRALPQCASKWVDCDDYRDNRCTISAAEYYEDTGRLLIAARLAHIAVQLSRQGEEVPAFVLLARIAHKRGKEDLAQTYSALATSDAFFTDDRKLAEELAELLARKE